MAELIDLATVIAFEPSKRSEAGGNPEIVATARACRVDVSGAVRSVLIEHGVAPFKRFSETTELKSSITVKDSPNGLSQVVLEGRLAFCETAMRNGANDATIYSGIDDVLIRSLPQERAINTAVATSALPSNPVDVPPKIKDVAISLIFPIYLNSSIRGFFMPTKAFKNAF